MSTSNCQEGTKETDKVFIIQRNDSNLAKCKCRYIQNLCQIQDLPFLLHKFYSRDASNYNKFQETQSITQKCPFVYSLFHPGYHLHNNHQLLSIMWQHSRYMYLCPSQDCNFFQNLFTLNLLKQSKTQKMCPKFSF